MRHRPELLPPRVALRLGVIAVCGLGLLLAWDQAGAQNSCWVGVEASAVQLPWEDGSATALRFIPSGDSLLAVASLPEKGLELYIAGSGASAAPVTLSSPNRIGAVGTLGDTLWVHLPDEERFDLFSLTGTRVDTVPAAPFRSTVYTPTHYPRAVLPERGLLYASWPSGSPGSAAVRPMQTFLARATDGTRVDTLAVVRGATPLMTVSHPSANRHVRLAQPFHADPVALNGGDDWDLVLIEQELHAASPAVRISWFASGSDSVHVQDVPVDPKVTSERHVSDAVDRLVSTVFTEPPWDTVSESDWQERIGLSLEVFEYLPAVTTTVSGTDGTVWWAGYGMDAEVQEWFSIAPARPAWRISIPANLRVVAVNPDGYWALEPRGSRWSVVYFLIEEAPDCHGASCCAQR